MEELEQIWTKRFRNEAVVVINDCPPGLEIGLDCFICQNEGNFLAFSLVPFGLHLLYYSQANFPRQGFFFNVKEGEHGLYFFSWNKETEEINPEYNTSMEFLTNVKTSILRGDYNDLIGQYNNQQQSAWRLMSQFVTKSVFEMVGCGINTTLSPGDDIDDSEDMQIISKSYAKMSPRSVACKNSSKFTALSKLENELIQREYSASVDHDTVTAKITSMKMDKSWLLQKLFSHCYNNNPLLLLGELQFAYIMFMMLYSQRGLRFWKESVTLICSSEHYLLHNPHFSFTNQFLLLFFHQLKLVDETFFEEEMSMQSFLLPCFNLLSSALCNYQKSTGPVKEDEELFEEHKNRFFKFIAKKFNINIMQVITQSAVHGNDAAASLEGENVVEVKDAVCVIDDGGDGMCVEEDTALSLDTLPNLTNAFRSSVQSEEESGVPDFDKPIPASEYEFMKYSWRYPLLCEAMNNSSGKEDLLMTAMRILEETEDLSSAAAGHSDVNAELVRNEAVKFVENEVPLMT